MRQHAHKLNNQQNQVKQQKHKTQRILLIILTRISTKSIQTSFIRKTRTHRNRLFNRTRFLSRHKKVTQRKTQFIPFNLNNQHQNHPSQIQTKKYRQKRISLRSQRFFMLLILIFSSFRRYSQRSFVLT